MAKRKKACTRAHTPTHSSLHAHREVPRKPEPLYLPCWAQVLKDGTSPPGCETQVVLPRGSLPFGKESKRN